MKEKRPLGKVLPIAKALLEELKPACKKIELAGSLRREQALIGDIELVCIPKYEIISFEKVIKPKGLDKFVSEPKTEIWRTQRNFLKEKLDELTEKGIITEFFRNGDKMKQFTAFNTQIDLFITTTDQWGVIFMIRTGSANYSKQFMIELNKRKEFWVKDGHLWRGNPEKQFSKIISTPNEYILYDTVGFPYKEPYLRNKEVF